MFVHAIDIYPDVGFFYRYGGGIAHSILHKIDVTNFVELQDFVKEVNNCSAIIFTCGLAGKECMRNPEKAKEIYDLGLKNTLKVAKKYNNR